MRLILLIMEEVVVIQFLVQSLLQEEVEVEEVQEHLMSDKMEVQVVVDHHNKVVLEELATLHQQVQHKVQMVEMV